MGFDLHDLTQAVADHGTVVRVVIADIAGSSPREIGAAMLVWQGGQSGTVGGGALEFEAAAFARITLNPCQKSPHLSRHPLGPELGQCCGGVVTLLTERYDALSVARLEGLPIIARPTNGQPDMPFVVQRHISRARNATAPVDPVDPVESQLCHGWMIEPVHRPTRPLWIWGAGHVGRAMITVLAPLPDFAITWIDTAPDRFPEPLAHNITILPATDPARLVRHAPPEAEHLILTYSHALDLELCHQLLTHGFAFAGLIGSATKWARFRPRLAALGHTPERIASITCPIGQPDLGKHPQTIAIGVAAKLLQKTAQTHKNTTATFREQIA